LEKSERFATAVAYLYKIGTYTLLIIASLCVRGAKTIRISHIS
jgi:hypothetical protein